MKNQFNPINPWLKEEQRIEDMKSILFELGNWSVGGVERVTVVLANAFVKRC